MRHHLSRARFVLPLLAALTCAVPAGAQNAAAKSEKVDANGKDAQRINEQSAVNLKLIGLGLLQYLQDWDERLPSMNSARDVAEIEKAKHPNWRSADAHNVQQSLYLYVKDAEVFAHPATGELYRPNVNLSGRSTFDFADRAPIVAFYEAAPAADGTRAVLYFDGRVIREREADWPGILAKSGAIENNRENDGKFAPDMSVLVPLVKTALGANRALLGSAINVDGRARTITLTGTVTSQAQRELAMKVAAENAPAVHLVIDLAIDKP